MNQHDRDSAELRRVCQERDNLKATCRELRAQVQLELERHRTTWTQLEQAKRECEELREELGGIKNISAETTNAMKRLVMYARTSGGTPGPDQGLMNACEQAERMLTIGGIGRAYMEGADAAMAKEASHV